MIRLTILSIVIVAIIAATALGITHLLTQDDFPESDIVSFDAAPIEQGN